MPNLFGVVQTNSGAFSLLHLGCCKAVNHIVVQTKHWTRGEKLGVLRDLLVVDKVQDFMIVDL